MRNLQKGKHHCNTPSIWALWQCSKTQSSLQCRHMKTHLELAKNYLNDTQTVRNNIIWSDEPQFQASCLKETRSAHPMQSTRWSNCSCPDLRLPGGHLGVDERTSPTDQSGKDWASCLLCQSNSTTWFYHPDIFINNYPIKLSQKSWCNFQWQLTFKDHIAKSSRRLRSASEQRLVVPSQRGTKSRSRTFSFTVPGWWNEHSTPIRNAEFLKATPENSSLPCSLDFCFFFFVKKTPKQHLCSLSLISPCQACFCSEQCLKCCITTTSASCDCLPLYNVSLIVFLNCKSLWIKASAKLINVNVPSQK